MKYFFPSVREVKSFRYGAKVCLSDGGDNSEFFALGGLCSCYRSTGRGLHVSFQLVFVTLPCVLKVFVFEYRFFFFFPLPFCRCMQMLGAAR